MPFYTGSLFQEPLSAMAIICIIIIINNENIKRIIWRRRFLKIKKINQKINPKLNPNKTKNIRKISNRLTGNIASGKSEAESIFRKHDIPTLDADKVVKDLLNGTQTYQKIKDKYKNLYPEIVLKKYNNLNKKLLRKIIFKDPKQKVSKDLLHPQVQQVI